MSVQFARPSVARPLAAIALLATFWPNVGHAADAVFDAPEEPAAIIQDAPVLGWDGAYVGLLGSYGFADADIEGRDGIDAEGARGGLFGGYNFQNGPIVYGAEADVQLGDVDGTVDGARFQTQTDGSLRARLGYALNDRLLIYGAGGLAAADVEIETPGVVDDDIRFGYTVGAGVDVELTDRLFARGEYRYNDFGDEDVVTDFGTQSLDLSENRVSFGLGFKF